MRSKISLNGIIVNQDLIDIKNIKNIKNYNIMKIIWKTKNQQLKKNLPTKV
jgi:hypothetical protein